MRKFTILGKRYAFTHITDNISRYSFNTTKHYHNGILQPNKNKPEYYHRIAFGLYYYSDHWLQ